MSFLLQMYTFKRKKIYKLFISFMKLKYKSEPLLKCRENRLPYFSPEEASVYF